MTSADVPRQPIDRGDAPAGRRDRGHDPRSRGERRAVAGDGRRPRADRPDGRHPTPRTARSTSRTSDAQLSSRTRLVAVGYAVERGRHDQPGRRDRPAGPRGRRADVRRRRPLRAARARSMSRRSGPTSWPARSTSSSARTSARSTAGPRSSTGCRSYKVRPAHDRFETGTAELRGRSPGRGRRSTTSRRSASASGRIRPRGAGDPDGRRRRSSPGWRAIRAYEHGSVRPAARRARRGSPASARLGDRRPGPAGRADADGGGDASTGVTPRAAAEHARRGRGSRPGTATSTPRA